MTITEKQLWYLCDIIATREADVVNGDRHKSDAASTLMRYLEKPSPAECKIFYERGWNVIEEKRWHESKWAEKHRKNQETT